MKYWKKFFSIPGILFFSIQLLGAILIAHNHLVLGILILLLGNDFMNKHIEFFDKE